MKKIVILVLLSFGLFLFSAKNQSSVKASYCINDGKEYAACNANCETQCEVRQVGCKIFCPDDPDPVDGKGGGDCTQTGCPTGQSCVLRNNQYKCVDDDPGGPLPTATPVPVATATPVPGATCPWSAPISISTLPSGSSGAIEGQADVIFPNNTQLLQSIYRGNQGYWRLVPVSGGNPQWGSAGAWSAPIASSTLPGSGTVQARSDLIIGNGANLVQALWRGDQGFTRTVPISGGVPVWTSASAWSAPISISTLPSGSSGAIEAQADVIFPNNTQLLQAIYRGNQGYWRLVPVSGGNPVWASAGAWSAPIAASTLPGSGTVQARSDYMIGNGANLVQALWRGDQGFTRTVPISGGVPQWGCATGSPTSTPKPPTATPKPPTSTPAPACPKKIQGDADCDGSVNLKDYFYYVAKKAGATLPATVNVDFNKSGTVDAADRDIVVKTLKP